MTTTTRHDDRPNPFERIEIGPGAEGNQRAIELIKFAKSGASKTAKAGHGDFFRWLAERAEARTGR